MTENIEERNRLAINWLKSKEETIDQDLPRMIFTSSIFGLEHVVKVIFSYIEIFAGAYQDGNISETRVNFIKVYFGRVDERYIKMAGLFYTIYRHGLIHDFHPKRIDYNKLHYDWCVYRANPELHLIIQKHPEDPTIRFISLSLVKLYLDLKSALKFYFDDLEKDEKLRNNAGDKVARIQHRYEYVIKTKNNGGIIEDIVYETEIYTRKSVPRSYINRKELEYLDSLEEHQNP